METLKRKLDSDIFEAILGKIYKDYSKSITLLQKWVEIKIWPSRDINYITPTDI
jgi:hypothetical protein